MACFRNEATDRTLQSLNRIASLDRRIRQADQIEATASQCKQLAVKLMPDKSDLGLLGNRSVRCFLRLNIRPANCNIHVIRIQPDDTGLLRLSILRAISGGPKIETTAMISAIWEPNLERAQRYKKMLIGV